MTAKASLYKRKQFVQSYNDWWALEADARWLYAKSNNMIPWPVFVVPCLPQGYYAVIQGGKDSVYTPPKLPSFLRYKPTSDDSGPKAS